MIKKILILANISIFTVVLSGCPSKAMEEKANAEYQKQQTQQRSDRQFEDMERQMNK